MNWDHITDEIKNEMLEELNIDKKEIFEWLEDPEHTIKCDYCKRLYPFFMAYFSISKTYCSEKCSRRGAKPLSEYFN